MRSPWHMVASGAVVLVLASGLGFALPEDRSPGLTARQSYQISTPAAPSEFRQRISRGGDPNAPSDPDSSSPGSTSPGSTSPDSTSSGSTSPGSSSPDSSGTAATPRQAPVDPKALSLARKWVQAWAQHGDGVTKDDWLDKLAPLTTDEYLPVLRTVKLSNIPASKVTGKPQAVSSTRSSARIEVATDGATVLVSAIATPDGWRVAQHEKAE